MAPLQHEQIDDEMLTAFLAGELSAEQSARVEQAINDDVALAARLDRLAQVDELTSHAYRYVLDEPVPQRLTDAVWQNNEEGQSGDRVVNLATRRRSAGYIPMAVAASVALVIGGLLGQQFASDKTGSHNPLYIALEQTPSQQRFEAGNGNVIMPVMSFRASDGRYCREFRISADRKVSVGVACKQEGYWNTEILLAADNHPADGQGYQPASDHSQPALDAVLDSLWAGVAYDLAGEKALIRQGWH